MAVATRFGAVLSAEAQMPSSWNEYITTVMADSGYVTKGAIYGTDGRKWASSKGFNISNDETRHLMNGFTDPTKMWIDGVRVGGKHFTCTRSESGLIVGRESSDGYGCVVYKCNKCLILAVHEEGAHPGGCYNLITKLGEYLKEQGV